MIFPSLIKGAGIGLSALGLFSGAKYRNAMAAINQQISDSNAQMSRESALTSLTLGSSVRCCH